MSDPILAPARALKIDLDALIFAMGFRAPFGQADHWLHLQTGEIRFTSDDGEKIDEAEALIRSDVCLHIEPIDSSESFAIMERFVEQCTHAGLANKLSQALKRPKPFRRFKDGLLDHPEQRALWFAFEHEAMKQLAQRWCEGHRIAPEWTGRLAGPPG